MSPMFVPGPVDVPPEILAAQARPMLPKNSQEFETLFHRTEEKLRKIFFTERPVYLVACSGAGMQEAAIRNLVQESVLCCANGAYSKRWGEIALANGKQVDFLETDWGGVITPEKLVNALKQKTYEAVTIVHTDASTGAENPLEALTTALRSVQPDTLILVDGQSSVGGVRIPMDEWNLDFLLTTSHQCLALPPGLAMAAVSQRAMHRASQIPDRGWYFDLVLMEKHRIKDSTPTTPAMPLIFALEAQLNRIAVEGLENRFERHTALAEHVHNWAEKRGMPLLAGPTCQSQTVSCLQNSRGFSVEDLNKFLLARGMRIANGYGHLKDKYFRIAHMGETQLSDLETLFTGIDAFLGIA